MAIHDMSVLATTVRKRNPLVVHYTNEVTINDCANAALAIGASPIMGDAIEEAADLIAMSSAVVLNIGKMHAPQIPLYLAVGKIANELRKPIVLDPVGVFASKHRTDFVAELLDTVKFDVIKGNAAEILFLAGQEAQGKGVDASDDIELDIGILQNFANETEAVVAATGKVDVIADGNRALQIYNGSPKLKSVTGTGCMTASLVGSYAGVAEDPFIAAAMGVVSIALSGELADRNNPGIGTFKVQLFDQLYGLDEQILNNGAKVEIV